MKKALKVILIVLLAIVVLAGSYLAYVALTYYRLEDNLSLPVSGKPGVSAKTDTEYLVTSYNIGFGAYSDDYSFFLDGGDFSRAFSGEAVYENTGGAMDVIAKLDPDFALFQEVDRDSTRSYHIDQLPLVVSPFPEYAHTYAQNYDSPYLFYPLTSPHGASVAGLVTLSFADIDSAVRRSLPVESGFSKYLDLDRCYSKSYVSVEGGGTLCLINLHMSAYSSDGSIVTAQLEMLLEDMAAEYAKGCYVIAGGDFNKDLLGDSSEIFGVSNDEFTWAQSFPFELMPEGFTLIAPYDEDNPLPSVRNADEPYDPETAFVLTIDGFIVSDNVSAISAAVIDTDFEFSDHNPVEMRFLLKG